MRLKKLLFIVVLFLTAVDQVTKWLAETSLPFQEAVSIVPFFSLYRTYNTGIAFSMFDWAGSTGLVIVALIIIALMLYLWSKVTDDHQLAHLGFALVIAGAIGNLIDWLTHGHVIDFFLFHTESWAFAVFNVADAFITIGAIAIIVDELFSLGDKKSATESPDQ